MNRRALSRTKDQKRAAVIVEMAVLTPLLILIFMGIIEFGWLFHVKSSLTTASRMGARTGTLPGMTMSEVYSDVDDIMIAMGFTPDRCPYEVDITMATAGNPYITVEVTVQYEDATVMGGFFSWLEIDELQSSTTLRLEVETGGEE